MILYQAGNLIPRMSWTRFRKNTVSRKTSKYSCPASATNEVPITAQF